MTTYTVDLKHQCCHKGDMVWGYIIISLLTWLNWFETQHLLCNKMFVMYFVAVTLHVRCDKYIRTLASKFSSVTQSCLTLWPHGLQHARLPCPSPTPRACSDSCLSSRWCHPTISSSVVPFSSCLQSFPASRSFPMSQFFTSGGQSIGVSASASVLPVNIQDWFPLRLTGWIS